MITATFVCRECGETTTADIFHLETYNVRMCKQCISEQGVLPYRKGIYSLRFKANGSYRVCIMCGDTFRNKPGKPYYRDCCGKACLNNHNGTLRKLVKEIADSRKTFKRCAVCKKVFALSPAQKCGNKSGIFYCSQYCTRRRRSVTSETRLCAICSKPFKVVGKKKDQRKTCSEPCRRILCQKTKAHNRMMKKVRDNGTRS